MVERNLELDRPAFSEACIAPAENSCPRRRRGRVPPKRGRELLFTAVPHLDLLDRVFYGATLMQWLLAAATLGGVYVALAVLRRVLVRRLGEWAKRTETRWDDVAIEAEGADRIVVRRAVSDPAAALGVFDNLYEPGYL